MLKENTMTKATDRIKNLFGLTVPEGDQSVRAGRLAWQQEQEAEDLQLELPAGNSTLEMAHEQLKPHSLSLVVYFSSRAAPSNLPKQFHQLWAKHSNIGACGGHYCQTTTAVKKKKKGSHTRYPGRSETGGLVWRKACQAQRACCLLQS